VKRVEEQIAGFRSELGERFVDERRLDPVGEAMPAMFWSALW